MLSHEGPQKASGGIQLATVADEKIVHGLILDILAFRFMLAVHAITDKTGLLAGAVNRPDCLHFQHNSSEREAFILIGWDVERDGGMIEVAVGFDP